jgi:hypothetical protein
MKTRKAKMMIGGALVLAFTLGTFTHWDWYPSISTYGVTVGVNSAYCSTDYAGNALEASCQSGG